MVARTVHQVLAGNLSPVEFHRSFKNHRPVIIKGALSQWNSLQRWKNPGYLASAIGGGSEEGVCLDVYISRDNRRFLRGRDMVYTVTLTPQQTVDYVFNYPPPKNGCIVSDTAITEYSQQVEVTHTVEPLRIYLRTETMPDALFKDIATPEHVDSLMKIFSLPAKQAVETPPKCDREAFAPKVFRQSHMQLWLGTKGNVTPLHYDRNHGLLGQIMGSKQVDLFSHADTSYLYRDKVVRHTSQIDLREFDTPELRPEALRKFPNFEEATRYRATLMPGDLLYTPPFWWHEVTSLDNSLSVTFPWDLSGNEEIPPIMLL